ncbi:hypothetical protein A0128_02890 [Leptospira tipperaryensis]|uniref:DUF4476 domain-containing protein n=1 Tax=Leptospira tipperaryensis TaxID=2564040 RepID=A0A1D7UTN4_9LEPT|nr:DUF4476 domain-containing protein [Leptospira tipperaryensis]AOP32903.1 hypothetical protein A0128_02890 [Leptospira tipperaryensis]
MFAFKNLAIATFVFFNFSIFATGHGLFTNIKSRVEKEGFSDRKLAILKSEASRTTFTADQVAELMDLFSFSADKMKALTSLRNRIEDPENAYVIVERFSYDVDKKNAASLLDGIESALPKPPRMSKRTVCWGDGPGRYCYTEYIEQ